MGVIQPSDSEVSIPHSYSARDHFGSQSFYGKSNAKTPSSSENSENTEKSAIVDISVDNELNLSRISLPENDNLIEDLVNEDPNLSGFLDLEVFNRSFNVSFVNDAGFNRNRKAKSVKS